MQNLMNLNQPCFSISATSTASTTAALPEGDTIRLVNEGPNNVYVSVGLGSQTATVPGSTANTTCVPILAGSDCVFSLPKASLQGVPNISAICRAASTATLLVHVGSGA